MAEVQAGTAAPEVPASPAPGALPVTPPTTPTGADAGDQSSVTPKTYTEDEHKSLVDKNVRERLQKERRRIERVARAEAEASFYRDLAQKGMAQPQPEKPKGRPQAKDFQTVEEFLDADYTWRRERERETEQRERQEREPKERANQSAQEFSRSLTEKLSDGAEKYPDFEDVVFSDDVPFTDPMVHAIHDSPNPRDLAYYLATHLADLRRIAKLPSTRQVIELGKIEDKLAAPPKPSGAPAPIVPTSGNSSGAKKDYSQMNTEEHVKAYRNRNKTT